MILGSKTLFFCGALLLVGCSEQPKTTPTEGAFGQIASPGSTNITRAKPPSVPALEETPILTVLQTELSPAILVQSGEREVSFFTEMERVGRAAPGHAAFSTRGGPRPFKSGERLAPEEMEENWVMVWFAGARGWTNGDVPWVVYLQHRPRSMRLDANGLHLRFEDRAGSLALLPLYGSYLCPTNETKSVKFGGKPVQTWKWGEVLHREPLMRVRYWASALRHFPADCEETFSVDRSTDTLTFRQNMSYVSIENDWATKPLKLHPISPTLALASRDESFPVRFSQRVMDLEMPTSSGPYMAAESDAPLEASLRVLDQINAGAVVSNANVVEIREVGSWSRWGPLPEKREACIAAARRAYRAHDPDGYNYACCLFTRALTRHHFDQLVTDYLRTFHAASRPAVTEAPASKDQRLIPSGPPSPFVPGIQREVIEPGEPLVAAVATDGKWPQITLRGTDLRFGSIKVGSAAPKQPLRLWHSPTTERIVVPR